jgi:glycosyltransferase involved in cell wall biosynthesis
MRKMDNDLVTIVTVTYNAEALLEETILSVLNQSFPHIEYIIVDGGSADGTVEIIQKYEAQIAFWVSEPDEGIYDAMNKAVSRATGKWINFMNAGDTFCSHQTLWDLFLHDVDDCDVIYGDRYYVKQHTKRLQKAKPIETILERMPFGHQAAFLRTSLMKQRLYNTTYRFAADYDLFVRLYREHRTFKHIDLPVCNFLAGGQSESGIRPYLEVLKILFDNTSDPEIIRQNAYLASFKKHHKKLLREY